MHHEYLDKYSRLDSSIHKVDARLKFFISFLFIFILSFSDDFVPFLIFMPIILLGILFSKVPLRFILKRTIFCLPFLLFLFFLPFEEAILLFVKAVSSIIIMILLVSTTKFTHILNTMRYFNFPKLFIMMFSFFYRYIFLLIDNIHKMQHAKESRCFSKRQSINIDTISKIIGSIFIRSYEQSERVYAAMLARGYDDKD